ncbi:MAG: transcription-repair coupling factor [Rhodocyclaceae bacterium]|nr:transcription-repair coupling factor [Rhodocyclaceae bacterium]
MHSPALPRLPALPIGLIPDRLPDIGQRHVMAGIPAGAQSLLIAELSARKSHPLLVVFTTDALERQRLYEELLWLLPDSRIRQLPDWETLPYDPFSPHHDLISERLATLSALQRRECDILLVAVQTALYRLPPPAFLAAHSFSFSQKQALDETALRAQLGLAGYQAVTNVISPGEFSIRGGLIDLFPMGSALPFRLDLFDREIESIKTFDVDSQRTLFPVPEVQLLPAREFPTDDRSRTLFRQRFREVFEGDPAKTGIYRDVSQGTLPAGIEYYLPLFFEEGETGTVIDYLRNAGLTGKPDPEAQPLVLFTADLSPAVQHFWQEVRSRYTLHRGDKARPLLPPEELFLSEESFFAEFHQTPRLLLGDPSTRTSPVQALPSISLDRRSEDPLGAFRDFLNQHTGTTVVIAETPGRRESILTLLQEGGLAVRLAETLGEALASGDSLVLITGALHFGFRMPGLALVTETELFAGIPRRKKQVRKKSGVDNWLRDLTELRIGDPVVHETHGVARYRGLTHLDLGDGDTEFMVLEFANEAKLYVPVSQMHLISRYSGGDPDHAPIHTLGSGQWEKAKRKAALQARDTAAELLALYATRAARQGHAFEWSENDYERFADGFGFEETIDQSVAIDAVLSDMRSGQPMDRLVCGDVGFGKTEVALRAAFAAVAGGKQVAVLCPTTLLCEQHAENFRNRFAEWPVRVVELSRFRTAKESQAALDELADGRADIVIGTHRLIQNDVKFARLGLLIIDEEHRFGVKQKEQLKALRAEVDVLTLTATPIPRTLAMSLEGLRDFSVIATAPQKRLAIKTFVHTLSDGIIREAILRELNRGGQVYFLHNEVDTIENMRERLVKLVPEARIVIGHGQMNERELESVMREFTQQRANVLLCTTIIETGIDNPHANTILINRADKFGLAQLHQLRGRVGRSHHQAYAYLMVQDMKGLTKAAKQRLEAIQMMEELGAGFYLAMHDLEIRGAGEVLGDSQSGEIQEVGFALFSEMLNRAVKAMKAGETPDLEQPLGIGTEINLRVPALLPDAYCPDVHERLNLYKRLSNADNADELTLLQEELIDRFGALPPQAESLIATHQIRLQADRWGMTKVDINQDQILVQFGPKTPADPMTLLWLIQNRRDMKLAGQDRIILSRHMPTLSQRIQSFRELCGLLEKSPADLAKAMKNK